MGVDFYSCKNCGNTFSDCGRYVSCECGKRWCSDECAEEDGYKKNKCKSGYEIIEGYEQNEECKKGSNGLCDECEGYEKGGCKYCREEDFDDYILLDFALKELGITREQLINRYKITQ
jgi:hypothetical protein